MSRCTLCCPIEQGLNKHRGGVGKNLKANELGMGIEKKFIFSKNLTPKITPETQKIAKKFNISWKVDAQIKF